MRLAPIPKTSRHEGNEASRQHSGRSVYSAAGLLVWVLVVPVQTLTAQQGPNTGPSWSGQAPPIQRAYYQNPSNGPPQGYVQTVQGFALPAYGYSGNYPMGGNPYYGYSPYASRWATAPYAYGAYSNNFNPNYGPNPLFSGNPYTPATMPGPIRRRTHWSDPEPPSPQAPPPAPAPAPAPPPEPVVPKAPPGPSLQERWQAFASDLAAKKSVPYCRPTNEKCWVAADYTVSFFRPMQFATPLVTVGNPLDPLPGALGQPGTLVVFGSSPVDLSTIPGVRLEIGTFADDHNRYSIEWIGFTTTQNRQSFAINSDANGNPVIARPFLNFATNGEDAFLIANPGAFTGGVRVETSSLLSSVELNARSHAYWWERLHADALFGLRYTRLAESLTIRDQITPLQTNLLSFNGTTVNAPSFLQDMDSFGTANYFVGPQFGGRLRWEAPRFVLDVYGKVAMGLTQEHVNINGSTSLVTPTGTQTVTGGVLAQQSNIGTFNRSVFGILPEFGLGVGVDVTPHVRVRLGYSVLIWNHVVRPGNQIDRNINPGQVPGSPNFGLTSGVTSPIFRFNDEMFWSQTFNVGIEAHF